MRFIQLFRQTTNTNPEPLHPVPLPSANLHAANNPPQPTDPRAEQPDPLTVPGNPYQAVPAADEGEPELPQP